MSAQQSELIINMDEALTRLEKINPRQAKVVELRFFTGLTEEEIGVALGISTRTVKREWTMARAWLYGELSC
jgi:RNA polymerase sigma factor (sigma-70 family)